MFKKKEIISGELLSKKKALLELSRLGVNYCGFDQGIEFSRRVYSAFVVDAPVGFDTGRRTPTLLNLG